VADHRHAVLPRPCIRACVAGEDDQGALLPGQRRERVVLAVDTLHRLLAHRRGGPQLESCVVLGECGGGECGNGEHGEQSAFHDGCPPGCSACVTARSKRIESAPPSQKSTRRPWASYSSVAGSAPLHAECTPLMNAMSAS